MLLDARESLRLTEDPSVIQINRGTHATVTFRNVSFASGPAWPNPLYNTVIQVGDGVTGSDAIRVRQYGGWIDGVVKVGSPASGNSQFRWIFRDAVRAPKPETVQFLGLGNHYLFEWSGDENVQLDQYRGGQGAALSIDSRKSFLLPITNRHLADTREAAAGGPGDQRAQVPPGSGRYGKDHTLTLPDTLRASGHMGGRSHVTVWQRGLAVYLLTESDTETQVTQFADSTFSAMVGATATIPAGERGGFIVHDVPFNIGYGQIFVRITKPGLNQSVEGRLVVDYFPYFGT
jgi:hypothetical protein